MKKFSLSLILLSCSLLFGAEKSTSTKNPWLVPQEWHVPELEGMQLIRAYEKEEQTKDVNNQEESPEEKEVYKALTLLKISKYTPKRIKKAIKKEFIENLLADEAMLCTYKPAKAHKKNVRNLIKNANKFGLNKFLIIFRAVEQYDTEHKTSYYQKLFPHAEKFLNGKERNLSDLFRLTSHLPGSDLYPKACEIVEARINYELNTLKKTGSRSLMIPIEFLAFVNKIRKEVINNPHYVVNAETITQRISTNIKDKKVIVPTDYENLRSYLPDLYHEFIVRRERAKKAE